MTSARLLDLTRLTSRAGLHHTGVDRVEAAYLHAFLEADVPAFGLVRTALGFVLLDRTGLAAFAAGHWGRIDLLSRWNRRLSGAAKRGQSLVRRHAIARARSGGLQGMLRKHLPARYSYYNTGHSNLTETTLRAVSGSGGLSSVLIHDTIPLDFPQMQRDGTVATFRAKLAAAAQANRIICTTHAVAADVLRHLPVRDGQRQQPTVAQLGVTLPDLTGPVPPDLPAQPYFVVLGTIEPRKNHALLLDIWESWPGAPSLVMIGKRGWKNEDVFARLTAGIPGVVERADIADADLGHWIAGARALLMPSFAEGFGLPPAEALALGTPAIVADLPACQEVLGKGAVYVKPSDRYLWEKEIKDLAQSPKPKTPIPYVPPQWREHFNTVLTVGW